jgi:hypothetical protein
MRVNLENLIISILILLTKVVWVTAEIVTGLSYGYSKIK